MPQQPPRDVDHGRGVGVLVGIDAVEHLDLCGAVFI